MNFKSVNRPQKTDGFIRGFGICTSVLILTIGAIMLGIIIGLGLKDAKLVKSAVQLEAPTRADDYQNVFEKHSSVNTTAPLKVANATSKRFQRWDTLRNTTGSVRDNLQHAKDTYKFHQAKTLSSDLRAKIHDYWQVDAFPEFKKTMHIPKEEWTTYKKKFEYLLAHPNSTKTFVIAFGGSSVTAGHDNFLEEAYPALVRKQLAPIFDLLGVKLQVLNAGIGNNPCYPYDLCLEAHSSANVDLVSWEQSLNCGRNPEPLEAFIRTSSQATKRPMILLMSSGTPYWEPSACSDISPEHPTLSPQQTAEARLPLDLLANQSSILWDFPFLQVPAAAGGAGTNLAAHYNKVAPIVGLDLMRLAPYKCKGPYGSNFGAKTLGKGKVWHPGVEGHKLRADSFSYFFTSILSSALSDIVMFQQKGRKKRTEWTDSARQHFEAHTWDSKRNPFPKPLLCDPSVCHRWVRPTCKTMIQPQFNPQYSLKKSLVVPGSVPAGWSAELSWIDVAGVRAATEQKRNYLDKKIIFVADNISTTPLDLIVNPRSADGHLWLCQVSRGFGKYPSTMGDLGSAAVVMAEKYSGGGGDVKKQSPSTARVLTMKKVPGDGDECFQSVETISGMTKISIQKAKAAVQINLAYMIYW